MTAMHRLLQALVVIVLVVAKPQRVTAFTSGTTTRRVVAASSASSALHVPFLHDRPVTTTADRSAKTRRHLSSLTVPFSVGNATDFTFRDLRSATSTTASTKAWRKPKRVPAAAATQLSNTAVKQTDEFKVFCDLDGCLVDFEHGIRQLFPDEPYHSFTIDDLHRPEMWKRAASSNSFFEHLPWAAGGERLWQSIQHLQPDILTGCPVYEASRREKFEWCKRELNLPAENMQHVDMAGHWNSHLCVNGADRKESACNVITCWSLNKHYESGPGKVLIDDRLSLKKNWVDKGGIFIHHTGDTDASIQQMQEHGILTKGQF